MSCGDVGPKTYIYIRPRFFQASGSRRFQKTYIGTSSINIDGVDDKSRESRYDNDEVW